MKEVRNFLIALLFIGLSSSMAYSQCQTWNNSAQKDAAENAHVVYRGMVKGKQAADLAKIDDENFNIAFDNWKKAYEIAPAADGQRPTHFGDGRKLYKAKMQRETDDAKKAEYGDLVLKLYDEQAACYKNEAYLMGRKAFDMFYMPKYGFRNSTYDAFKKAIDLGGNSTEYIVLEPMAQVIAYLFKAGKVDQVEAQKYYEKMEAIAEHNMANNERYKTYYESASKRMAAAMAEVEDDLFDCDYFKKKLVPKYKENPDDLEVLKYAYVKLRQEGCDTTTAIMVEIKTKYEAVAAEINAALEEERRKNNPGYDAVQLQKEGKYEEAVARYKEAIETEENNDAKAQFYYSIAFIQTWQFSQYSSARENARKAASLKPGWGKPYILIGDMYGKTSRSCGDDWGNRMAVLAAIEKYAYAKSIDSEVTSEANKRIGSYSGAKPDKQEGFMRGVKAGQKVKVGCWIGETVTVRYK